MKTILFDLDGTLLSISQEEFTEQYFNKLIAYFSKTAYDPKIIMDAIWKGISCIQKNDGTKSNEDYFWEVFSQTSNIKKEDIYEDFAYFYTHDFETIEQSIVVSDSLVQAVNILKEKGYQLICATNPMFPSMASASRLRWSGVNPSYFDEITTYEDYHYCKPSPEYFNEILTRFDVDAKDVIMVGNDAQEDGAVMRLGIPLYLINNHLIDRANDADKAEWVGSDTAFLEFVKNNL